MMVLFFTRLWLCCYYDGRLSELDIYLQIGGAFSSEIDFFTTFFSTTESSDPSFSPSLPKTSSFPSFDLDLPFTTSRIQQSLCVWNLLGRIGHPFNSNLWVKLNFYVCNGDTETVRDLGWITITTSSYLRVFAVWLRSVSKRI